jgi:hypothetical protein
LLAREQSAAVNIDDGEVATVQFRVQFLDASAAVIKEMLVDTQSEIQDNE